jgi:hypothetical protein
VGFQAKHCHHVNCKQIIAPQIPDINITSMNAGKAFIAAVFGVPVDGE